MRDRICLLEYEPRTRLSEAELARESGVSRTPIRSVLNRLEGEGLAESRHGVGIFVTDVDIEALEQVYRLRMELAVLIGKLDPIPREPSDLERLQALLFRCEQLMRSPDPNAYARFNMAFFHELAAKIGNLPVRQTCERLYYLTTRIWLKSVPMLNLQDEISFFRREISEILVAM